MTPAEKRRRSIRTKYRNNVKSGKWAYSMLYDAYYDTKTRRWVEKRCKDRDCSFCSKRPRFHPRKISPPQLHSSRENKP